MKPEPDESTSNAEPPVGPPLHSDFARRDPNPERPSGFRWSAPDPVTTSARSLASLEPAIQRLDPRVADVLERCFARLCGRDMNIDVADLRTGLALKSEYLAQRILCVLDEDRDGLIDRDDFLGSVRTLLVGSPHERLRFAFRIHDLDGDSMLDRGELQRMIALGLREDALEIKAQEAERLTEIVLAGADGDGDGKVSLDEFEAVVMKHPRVLEQITRSGMIWIAPDDHLREHIEGFADEPSPGGLRERLRAFATSAARTLDNRATSIVLVLCWTVLNAGLFEHAMMVYALRGQPLNIQIARGAGACLNLNCALLLLPMLRLTLTWVRRTKPLRVLPVDDALGFHRLLGSAVLGLALVHTAAHLWFKAELWRHPFQVIAGMHAGPSGAVLLLGLLALWVCALPQVRGRFFELFYLTHLFYLGFFALLFVHAPRFWIWGTLPCVAFAIDRALRWKRRTHASEVVGANALRSEVTRLELRKPKGFSHRPTDYVFLRIPEVAPHEWHPFTISSAPERERLAFHIRKLGNWTRELHALIASGRAPALPGLAAEIDGPYGAPSAHIFESRYAVLIGAGIGATPFASVLESIARNSSAGQKLGELEKVHFYWIDKDQRGFEWFRELLASIERIDAGRRIDIRIHMTRGRSDAASAIVCLARELAYEKGRPDLVTGLKACTRMGHPDLLGELATIKQLHDPEPVPVFFCGPPSLGRKVASACLQLGMEFRQEQF